MNTSEKIEAAKNELGNIPGNHLEAYTTGMALRLLHSELEKDFLRSLASNPEANPLQVQNSKGHVLGLVRGRGFADFAALETALKANEVSEHFREAFAIVHPLVERVATLEAELQAEVDTYAEKLRVIHAAEETALEKARLALEKDQNISKLRSQAEAVRPAHIEPPPLFRGRVEIKRESEALPV